MEDFSFEMLWSQRYEVKQKPKYRLSNVRAVILLCFCTSHLFMYTHAKIYTYVSVLVLQFWAAYVPCDSQYKDAVRQTLEQIDIIHRMCNKYPEDFMFASSSQGSITFPWFILSVFKFFLHLYRICNCICTFMFSLPLENR